MQTYLLLSVCNSEFIHVCIATKSSGVYSLVIYPDHSTEMEFSLIAICSYANWCGLCSSITIENASSVSEVDWTNCNETRLYNMTVTNSFFGELYLELKSCCSGSLTIKYRSGRVSTAVHSTQVNEAHPDTFSEGLGTGTPLTRTTRNRLRKGMASNSRIKFAKCTIVLS
ncbi:uncharacterized protein LOC144626943 [Crassostrea virginica]